MFPAPQIKPTHSPHLIDREHAGLQQRSVGSAPSTVSSPALHIGEHESQFVPAQPLANCIARQVFRQQPRHRHHGGTKRLVILGSCLAIHIALQPQQHRRKIERIGNDAQQKLLPLQAQVSVCARPNRSTSGFCLLTAARGPCLQFRPATSESAARVARRLTFSHSAYCTTVLLAIPRVAMCAQETEWFRTLPPAFLDQTAYGCVDSVVCTLVRRLAAAPSRPSRPVTCAYLDVSAVPSQWGLMRIVAPSTGHSVKGFCASPVTLTSIAPNPPTSASSSTCSASGTKRVGLVRLLERPADCCHALRRIFYFPRRHIRASPSPASQDSQCGP